MKSIFTTILAAVMLLSVLGGCAKDMSGETRNTPPAATATARPTASPAPTPRATESSADGILDEGKDAVDGVVGAGEDAVNDIVDAGEDMVDDVTGRNQNNNAGSGRNDDAGKSGSAAKPTATPKSADKD